MDSNEQDKIREYFDCLKMKKIERIEEKKYEKLRNDTMSKYPNI